MLNKDRQNDLIYLVRYLFKLIDKDLDNRLSEYGLTGQQGRILFFVYIKTKQGIEVHQNDIENEYHLSKSTVSGLVKRMEKKGLLSIEKQYPYAILKPAEQGINILCHLKKHREEVVKQIVKDVSKEEQETLNKLLIQLIENMGGGNDNVE